MAERWNLSSRIFKKSGSMVWQDRLLLQMRAEVCYCLIPPLLPHPPSPCFGTAQRLRCAQMLTRGAPGIFLKDQQPFLKLLYPDLCARFCVFYGSEGHLLDGVVFSRSKPCGQRADSLLLEILVSFTLCWSQDQGE